MVRKQNLNSRVHNGGLVMQSIDSITFIQFKYLHSILPLSSADAAESRTFPMCSSVVVSTAQLGKFFLA